MGYKNMNQMAKIYVITKNKLLNVAKFYYNPLNNSKIDFNVVVALHITSVIISVIDLIGYLK